MEDRNDTNEERLDAIERLEEIKLEMLELVNEALDTVCILDETSDDEDCDEGSHARRTWYAHIVTSLTEDHEWCVRSHTLEDSISTFNGTLDEEV